MELIQIKQQNGEQVVSARELHTFLEVKTDFTDWCKRMFEYGFEEEKEFTSILGKTPKGTLGGRPSVDYALTLDCAKEIAMLQRTDKGKQARTYFIECEKSLKSKALDFSNPDSVLQLVQNWKEETERNKALQSEIKALEPKRIFADAVSASKTTILVGELAKILKQNGIDIGQNRMFEWLREKGYLIKRKGTDFNMPTQVSMNNEFFEIKETVIAHSDGHTSISKTAKVTGKGQTYFINKFLNQTLCVN